MKIKNLLACTAFITFSGHSGLYAQSTWSGVGTSESRALWSLSSNWSLNPPSSSSSFALVFNNTAGNSFANNDLTGLTLSSIDVPARSILTAPRHLAPLAEISVSRIMSLPPSRSARTAPSTATISPEAAAAPAAPSLWAAKTAVLPTPSPSESWKSAAVR